ncbi:MAG: hypothetical protein ACKOA8_20645, partial [Deltaproteobacteria bacterium]
KHGMSNRNLGWIEINATVLFLLQWQIKKVFRLSRDFYRSCAHLAQRSIYLVGCANEILLPEVHKVLQFSTRY